MENTALIDPQARLIQQLQAANSQTVCYATSASRDCCNKECQWRRDCISAALNAKRKLLNKTQKWRLFQF